MPNKQKSITSPKRYTMKQISLWIILLLVQLSVFAQKDETIVKIDKVEYSSIEFDYHYRKNAKILDQRESPQMYLERFIDYKLKLAEALRLKLDTVNNFLTEFQNYKLSLSNKHNAQGIIRDSLVHIAYKRLNEARNVSIITILAPEGSDTVRAFKRADSLYQALRKGASFADLATTKSEDMALKPKKGNIGYITGNMLPIQLENVLYTLKKGEFSAPIRTQKGYHIFRVNDITINPGEMRIAHIVKFFGTDSTQNKARLDSMMLIHKEIKEGADFVKLAIMYSDDETVKETKAELPWFKINQVLP
ncbi:MAG: hypothetical protein RIS47_1342, partial [Bacteroidota bacterium]